MRRKDIPKNSKNVIVAVATASMIGVMPVQAAETGDGKETTVCSVVEETKILEESTVSTEEVLENVDETSTLQEKTDAKVENVSVNEIKNSNSESTTESDHSTTLNAEQEAVVEDNAVLDSSTQSNDEVNTNPPIEENSQVSEENNSQELTDTGEEKNGWIKEDGHWCYYDNGSKYTNDAYSIFHEASGNYYIYRFDSSGYMITGWYTGEWGDKYYYAADGHQVSGIQKIDGATYYFNDNMVYDQKIIVDGIFYHFGADGKATVQQSVEKDGFVKVGEDWYYIKNQQLACNEFIEDGGYTYYLNYEGRMVKNEFVYQYDEQTQGDKIYRFDAYGHMVIGWYTNEWGDKYYYAADGHQVTGIQKIDGATYYFNDYMYVNQTIIIDGVLYHFGEDGKATVQQSVEKDGFIKIGEDWYYVRNKQLVCNEFIEDGGYTYYLSYDGRMVKNSSIGIYDDSSSQNYEYRFDEYGHMVIGWYTDEWGSKYYYAADGHQVSGLQNIEGELYYFNYSMYTNQSLIINGVFYHFGEDGKATVQQSVEKDGFVKVGEDWYYIRNQQLVCNEFIEDGGYRYYLNSDGRMVKNNRIYLYDEETQEEKIYRFDESGHMITGWYTDEWGSKYYYAADGHQVTGIQNIDGATYYFNNHMYVNQTIIIDGKFYHFGEDGKATVQQSVEKDGFVKVEKDWYYIRNQQLVCDEFIEDGGYTYYLNYDGKMVKNVNMSIYDDASSQYYEYRFDKYGHMITGWYTDEWQQKEYYHADGHKANGFTVIDGDEYYFEGSMQKDYAAIHLGVFYYFGSDGKSVYKKSIDPTQWIFYDEKWYYAYRNKLVRNQLMKIGAHSYYFDWSGEMLKDTTRYDYDYDTGREYWQRFDRYGHMVTSWYKDDAGTWYYYGSDGRTIGEGIKVIGGKTYLLANDGQMLTNQSFADGNYLYYFDDKGNMSQKVSLSQDGWKKMPDGWYYVQGKELKRNGLYKIGAYYYQFDYLGRMYADTTVSDWDQETNFYRRFDKFGHMITGWYKDDAGTWYYYGSDGRTIGEGIKVIGGKTYLLANDGQMLTNRSFADGNYLYYFDDKGNMSQKESLSQDGWKKMPDGWYYVQGKELKRNGLYKIGAYYYQFDYLGRMYADTTVSDWDQETNFYRRFDKSGHMITGWYKDDAGTWYYYGSDGRTIGEGIKVIGGKTYLLANDGQMLTNQSFADGNYLYYFDDKGNMSQKESLSQDGWKKMPDGWYYVQGKELKRNGLYKIGAYYYQFDYLGRMYADTTLDVWDPETGNNFYRRFDKSGHMVVGWYQDIDGRWYYYDYDGKTLKPGLSTIDGSLYYTDYYGMIIINKTFSWNGKMYIAGINGKCSLLSNEGWINNTYYVENGKYVVGWKYLQNHWYYFDNTNGAKYKNGIYAINEKSYYFDRNGKMKTGWIKFGPREWLYAKGDGALISNNWYTIGNKKYYFVDNIMATDIAIDNGKYYLLNSDGSLSKELENKSNGWLSANNLWYYLEENKLVKDAIRTIDGKKYYFSLDGIMQRDLERYEDGVYYYFGQSGAAIVNQWRKNYLLNWEYYGSDGTKKENGWEKIQNVWYYFDGGEAVTHDCIIDNILYYFRSSGSWTGKSASLSKGWNLINGQYYYYNNDGVFATGMQTIGGKKYYFWDNGEMAYNTTIYVSVGSDGTYYFAELSGAIAINKWCNDKTYYAGNDGRLYKGLQTIEGKQYYFNQDAMLVTGDSISSDGTKLYIIDKVSHNVIKILNAKTNGWLKSESDKWFYSVNGIFKTGVQAISGKLYYMNPSTGEMVVNAYIDEVGYANSNGVVKTNGWFNNTYFQEGNILYGAQTIDGKEYYFSYNGNPDAEWHLDYIQIENLEGIFFVDGSFYYYDGNGNRSKVNLKEGWNEVGKIKCYLKNGYLAYGADLIDGQYYFFDENGMLMRNCFFYEGDMYIGEDGQAVKGWKLINGKWYYFDDNYHYITGKHVINGVTYYFDYQGQMIKN